MCLQEPYLKHTNIARLKVKGWEKIPLSSTWQRRPLTRFETLSSLDLIYILVLSIDTFFLVFIQATLSIYFF